MGNILTDIVEEINVKPNKSKLVIKWIVSISLSAIVIAFGFGQFKSSFLNRMDKFEESINKNTESIQEIKSEMNNGFVKIDMKIEKIYNDGFEVFADYQEFNKKQLIMVLDYGQTNKNLLKEMLELNLQEKTKNIETKLEQSKNEPVVVNEPKFSIGVKQVEPQKKSKDYISLIQTIGIENSDTIFHLTGATKEFINKIDRNRYSVGAIIQNNQYPNLFDVNYKNK